LLVFVSDRGAPLSAIAFSRMVERAAVKAGLEDQGARSDTRPNKGVFQNLRRILLVRSVSDCLLEALP
jgi:hypothetical protein